MAYSMPVRSYYDGTYFYDRRAYENYAALPYLQYGVNPFDNFAAVANPTGFRADRRHLLDREAKYRSRVHELERQAWAQAQIIQEQNNMLQHAALWDSRGAYPYAYPQQSLYPQYDLQPKLGLAARRPVIAKKKPQGQAGVRLTEKRLQAKQFKTFIRTHFTVRAAFRFVEHFISGEEKSKFNADTRPFLSQFSEELKRPKPAMPNKNPDPPAPNKIEETKEFFDIATRHLRHVVQEIKNHQRYQKSVMENSDHEKSIDASMTENQEGRICLSRLMIYAITAFGIPGNTRLHQIANLLQEMQINMEQDPDLISAILAEAEARARNYKKFCHSSKAESDVDLARSSTDSVAETLSKVVLHGDPDDNEDGKPPQPVVKDDSARGGRKPEEAPKK